MKPERKHRPDPISNERLVEIANEPPADTNHPLAGEHRSMAVELLSARQALLVLAVPHAKVMLDAMEVSAKGAAQVRRLIQTLNDIREHVFAELTPETSPPRNRLQVIASKVDNVLAELKGSDAQ
jgi:uncharacterized coiled-coil protein SlyX